MVGMSSTCCHDGQQLFLLDGSRNSHDKAQDENNGEQDLLQLSFAQLKKKRVCCCCGKTDHVSGDCPDNDKPKSDWFINKNREVKEMSDLMQDTTPSQVSMHLMMLDLPFWGHHGE